MNSRIPKHLRGPFVCAFYDQQNATLYLKKSSGEWTSTITYPSFFILKKNQNIFPFDEYGKYILDKIDEGKYIRLVRDPNMDRDILQEMISVCQDENVPLYEADVNPIRRWFSDTGSLVEKKYKTLFFDLETHPLKIGFDNDAKKQHRIISWAAMDEDGNSWFEAANESSEKEELILLKKFVNLIQNFDTLLAWNGDNYDFFVLKARCKRHDFYVPWKKWNLLDHMKVVKKVLMSIPDSNFKRSFALDSIGENVLGIRKIKLPVHPGKMHTLLGERVHILEEYNLRDVEIMREIEQRREFLDLHYTLCSFCRTFPNKGSIFPNELADGILLRLALKENKHFPSRSVYSAYLDNHRYKKYEGAYVMDPVVGFHENVQVPDFASLYPSIILSWNMSNETVLEEGEYKKFKGRYAYASTTGVAFRTDIDGIIPKALRSLIQKRNEYKVRAKSYPVGSEEWKNMNNLSTAVKVATNSFYGLIGNEVSRYYNRDIARSVTLMGQYLIKETAKYFDAKGYQNIYSDTDSLFIKCQVDEIKKEIPIVNEEYLPKLLKQHGCVINAIKLDYDKGFKTILLVAKKRYVGRLALHKGRLAPDNMEPEIKGLETQRSDQIRYAQRILAYFMNLLIEPDCNPIQIDEELRNECDKFYRSELSRDEIEITSSVSKHPEEYNPKTSVVKVAEQMIKDGKEFFPGMKVPTIVIEHKNGITKAIHANEYTGKCDRKYYWEKKILPPITRLLDVRFPNYPFNSFKHPGQRLFDFTTTQKQPKRRIRQPKMIKRNVRIPSTTKTKNRRIRKPIAVITVPEKLGTSALKGIAHLVNGFPGDLPLKIIIQLEELKTDVIIGTDCKVSEQGLKEIKKLFPALIILPK